MEEIPYFQKLNADYKKDGLQILFVSLDMQNDFPDKVNSFIQKRKISTYWLDETNADYFCPIVDPSWSGAIPASLFIFNKNEYRKFIEESLSENELNKEVRILLGKSQ